MLYAYFDPNNRAVLGWFDTEAHDVTLPSSDLLVELDQEKWDEFSGSACWVDYSGALVMSAPALIVPLDQALSAKIAELNAACAAAIVAGFQCDALGEAYTYPSDIEDQLNLTGSVQLSQLEGADDPEWVTPFKCADKQGTWSAVAHTAAQIQKVGVTFTRIKLGLIGKKDLLIAQAKAAASVADIEAVMWAGDGVAA
ncbi:hypothetical protein [Pseudomonas luteola]|uniref:DUF4376 domain-containing protein n=1 Tax=Pseudomonas luteola TaxID=47886 RepID=UPI0015E2F972|nr:hypothetical protein [Pseudomonas zeshuii]MBA1250915.1 hypothetical protein [Pseudomonas zeshuii]